MFNDTPARNLHRLLGVRQWYMHEGEIKQCTENAYDYKNSFLNLKTCENTFILIRL